MDMKLSIAHGNPTSLFTTRTKKKRSKMKFVKALACLAVLGTAASLSLSSSTASSNQVDRRGFVGSAAAGIVAASFASPVMAEGDDYADFITTESGLKYKVTKEGDGAVPSPGQTVKAHYTGWLDGFDSIKKFDSSRDRMRPFSFKVNRT
jgi:FKBP-type peptidyl-prolyl cis-trans isomerase